MSIAERYRVLVCGAIESMWEDWARDEPLYLTAERVGERASVSTVTARKHLEQMHSEGWVGKKKIGKKLTVYLVSL